MLTYDELKEKYKELEKIQKNIQNPVYFKDNYVFDENMSVKWNRLKVESENQRILDDYNKYREYVTSMEVDYASELKDFLLNDSDYGEGRLTEKQLSKIEYFIYEYHEDDSYYENGFDSLMVLYQDLIEIALSGDE